MTTIETDYLIVGAGATGLAFADTLLAETQASGARITIVDRHTQPGGHWNDAYPFVALHQPSAFYGVNSLELGTRTKDTLGHNAGLYELASGPEVTGYFHRVMHQSLLPSGRVRYLPATRFLGVEGKTATVAATLSGARTQITVAKKWVDATHFTPKVPATTPPAFAVAEGVALFTPTQLTQRADSGLGLSAAQRFCIVGAGKTAMDVAGWLLTRGASPDQIHWVMPRDSWLINRLSTQPGEEFFAHSLGGMAKQMRALAEASSVADLFERLEAAGQMLRIDRNQVPTMFHYATISEGEVEALREIKQVIRMGRVQSIERERMVLTAGDLAMPKDTIYINCTASGVEPRASEPMFQPGKIVPQLVRAPLVSFSAALCAFVEAHYADDAVKNEICRVVPFPRSVAGWIDSTLGNMNNQARWSKEKALRQWMRQSRLDGFSRMAADVQDDDEVKGSILEELFTQGMAAVSNAKRLRTNPSLA
jgi:hypothetical protein